MDIGNIEDPQSFILFIEGRGYKMILSELKELQGIALDVKIPEKELSLMYVKSSICEEFMDI